MSTKITLPDPSPSALKELHNCFRRVEVPVSARRLWERHLSRLDKERLGYQNVKEAWLAGGTANMWALARGTSLDRAVLEVGKLLGFLSEADFTWLMREIGESLDGAEAMRVAVNMNDLVLCNAPAEVYWKGELLEFDWDRYPRIRTFLWELARHGKQRRELDAAALDASSSSLTNWKYRLTSADGFPGDLDAAIESIPPRRQRLGISPEQIRIFDRLPDGTYREWLP